MRLTTKNRDRSKRNDRDQVLPIAPPKQGNHSLSVTTSQFNAGNTGVPIEGAVRLQIFCGEPEGAVINWINRHRRIIAPAA
jgi:hypothetical protein